MMRLRLSLALTCILFLGFLPVETKGDASSALPLVPATPTATPQAMGACPDPSTRVMFMFTYLDANGNTFPVGTSANIERCAGAACTPVSIATGVTSQLHLSTGLSTNTLYRFRYSVTDGSGTSGLSPIVDVMTATTNDHIVRYPATLGPSANGFAAIGMGPLTCAATTSQPWDPFTWLSSNQSTRATYWKGRIPKHGPSTLTGTITTTAGSPTLTGTGTAFLQELNTADGVPALPAPFNTVYSGSTLLGTISSCSSNTSCTLTANALAVVTGASGNNNATSQDDQFLTNIYYDLGWNLYINAFRQGTVSAFEEARWVVDSWFSGRNRQGRGTISLGTPRGASVGGLIARALDGRPEIWDTVVIWTFEKRAEWITNHLADTYLYSARDQGYLTKIMCQVNRVLPDSYPTSNGTCTTVNNCGGTFTDGATLRDSLKTSIASFITATQGWQQDSGLWVSFGSGGAGNSEDTAGANGFGQTLLMPLLLDALGDVAGNTNLTSGTRNSARLQVLRGANYLWMISYNTQRVDNRPSVNHRANWYSHGGGTIPNPDEYRFGGGNALLEYDSLSLAATRQNGCTVPNVFAHAFAFSGKTVYQAAGMEIMNSLWAEIGENEGGTGDGIQNIAFGTDGKNYSECYRASMQMLARNLETPSSLGTAPIANAGPDITSTGNVVTIPVAVDGCTETPCKILWSVRVGPQASAWDTVMPTIVNDTTSTPTFINGEPGIYTLVKVVTDALGMGDDDTMQLTIPGASRFKPTVSCFNLSSGGYPIQQAAGTTTTTISCFAASSGASETFSWAWGTVVGPKNLSAAVVATPTSSSSLVTAPGNGDYIIPITATGNTSGLSRTVRVPFTVHRTGNAIPTLAQNTLPVVLSGLDQNLGAGLNSTFVQATIVDAKTWQTFAFSALPPAGWVINSDGNLNIRGPGEILWICTNGATVATSTSLRTQVSNWTGSSTMCTPTYNDGLDSVAGNSITITSGAGGPRICTWSAGCVGG